jgi:hypothetical protein
MLIGILLAGGSAPAAADPPAGEQVRTFPGPGSVLAGADATLVRQSEGISFTFSGTDLVEDHAYTIWFVAFNAPAGCTAPMTEEGTEISLCGVADLVHGRGEPTALWSAGHVVGRSGKSTWGGRMAVGDISGCTERGQLPCNQGLTDPGAAEVHLVLRSHGPRIPELVDEQIHSFNEGCYEGQPNAGPPPLCRNVQFAAFMP